MRTRVNAITFAAVLLANSSAVEAVTISTRAELLKVFETALALFQKECGFSLMRANAPGDLDCGRGYETLGTVWDRMLVQAGYPKSFDDREQIGTDLNLDPRTSLVLQGMARPEGIDHLLSQLR